MGRAVRSLSMVGVLAALAFAACRTSTRTLPAGGIDAVVTRSRATATWAVLSASATRGFVVRHETNEPTPRFFFLVQTTERQDLGMIDAQGRAWRYRPHAKEPEWVLTGTVAQGARAILGCADAVELVEPR